MLDLLDAMGELIPQTSALPSLPNPLQRLAEAIDQTGGAALLHYREIADAAELLSEHLARGEVRTEPWTPVPSSTLPVLMLKDGSWNQVPYRDAIRTTDEAMLLLDTLPVRLGGIGLTIWEAVGSGVAPDRLVQHVIDTHGAHPEAEHLVHHARSSLVDGGVIAHREPMLLADVMAGRSRDDLPGGHASTAAAEAESLVAPR
jgi:hypothetical protein